MQSNKKFNQSFFIVVGFLLAAASLAAQEKFQIIIVDGQYDDWDLTNDFFSPMYKAGNRSKEHLSNAYLRYDKNNNTVFVLVLRKDGAPIIEDEPWVKVYSLGRSTLVNSKSGNDGVAPDFSWIMNKNKRIGWEGSFQISQGHYSDTLELHVNHGARLIPSRRVAKELDTDNFFSNIAWQPTPTAPLEMD